MIRIAVALVSCFLLTGCATIGIATLASFGLILNVRMRRFTN